MKESDIKKKFTAAADAFAKRLEESYGATYVAALRDAVTSLQENGLDVSLEVRLRRNGSPWNRSETPALNATTIADGQRLDWVILTNFNKANLIAFDAAGSIVDFEAERKGWTGPFTPPPTNGAVPLGEAIANVIIEHIAQAKAAAAFGIAGSGIGNSLDKKPIAPALKAPAP